MMLIISYHDDSQGCKLLFIKKAQKGVLVTPDLERNTFHVVSKKLNVSKSFNGVIEQVKTRNWWNRNREVVM